MPRSTIHAVLFDLDGTLADTAADLAYALNCMRAARSLPSLPLATTRPYTSLGARGLLNVGLDDMDVFMKEKIRLYTEGARRLGLGK